MKRTAAVAIITLALLAGCGSGGENDLAEGQPTEEIAVDAAGGDAPFDGDVSELRVPAEDIKLTCEPGYQNTFAEITNTARTARHFHITVYFSDDAGVRIDQGFAHPYNVEPGETVRQTFSPIEAESWASCRVGRALAIPADTAPNGEVWWPLP